MQLVAFCLTGQLRLMTVRFAEEGRAVGQIRGNGAELISKEIQLMISVLLTSCYLECYSEV